MAQWGISRANTYDAPHVSVGPQGEVYVTDPEGAALVFDRQGNLLAQAAEHGSGDGQFSKPLGLAIAVKGHLYVADAYSGRIQRYRTGLDK